MTSEQKSDFIELLKAEPRRFIAQEVIDFQDLDILDEVRSYRVKADLRAFVLMADEPLVWASGLTRFSRNRIRSLLIHLKEEVLKIHGYYLVRSGRSPVLVRTVY